VVTLESPEDDPLTPIYDEEGTFSGNFYLSFTSNISSCSIYIDDEVRNADYSYPTSGITYTLDAPDVTEGLHDWQISCTDDQERTTYSNIWEFLFTTVLPERPTVTLVDTPNGGTVYYQELEGDSSWDKCRNITLLGGNSELTDFPYYINLPYDSDMLEDYSDLRFMDTFCSNSGTELDYEIESYTGSNAHIWVRIPTLPAGGTTISVYYKNNTWVGEGNNTNAVWDFGYKMVQHMDDETTSTIKDSTQYGNDGTKIAANGPVEVAGRIGNAQDFERANDEYIGCGNDASTQYSDLITIGAWVKLKDIGTGFFHTIIDRVWSNRYWHHISGHVTSPGKQRFSNDNPQTKVSNTALTADTWYYVTVTWTNSTKTAQFFLNGEDDGSQVYTGGMDGPWLSIKLGAYGAGGSESYYLNGTMDEFRLSNTTRTADWINMSYQIVENQVTYVSIGSEEEDPEWVGDIFTGTFNVSFSAPLDACSLYLDGRQKSILPFNVTSPQGEYRIGAIIDEGSHTWYVTCMDVLEQTDASNIWSFLFQPE